MSSLNIGCHLSAAKGYSAACETALSINANTFQFFTRNPRGGSARTPDTQDIEVFGRMLDNEDFAPIVAHAPYTINMASPKEEVYTGANELTKADTALLETLPVKLYNVHPGSRGGALMEEAFSRIKGVMDTAMQDSPDVFFLLETMSGKKNEMGSSFEEIREMIARAEHSDRVGVTLDTCHVYCAGYDIVNELDCVITQFDRIIGLDRLKAVHLNDSANPFNSHKDRHARLGEGSLGRDAFVRIVNHPALKSLPFILETPNEPEGYKAEIAFLRDSFKG